MISEMIPIDVALSGIPDVASSYWVLRGDAALAGMPYPRSDDVWRALAAAGFANVVCLTDNCPRYDPAPLVVDGFMLEDLAGGGPPSDPLEETTIVHRAVAHVLALLSDGRSVVVHCQGGRGRTGTVVGGALVSLGHGPSTVTRWLDELHRGRRRDGWPESDWQRAVLEDFGDRQL
jgi:hypothetical protein